MHAAELGAQSAGGNPLTFEVSGPTLAARVARLSEGLDGLVLVAGKSAGLAGLLAAAARTRLPLVVLPGGEPGTFKYLVEACGLCLPGASTAREPRDRNALARRSGWQAVTLVHARQGFLKVFGPKALANARALDASLGSSASDLAALDKVAREAGLTAAVQGKGLDKVRAYLKTGRGKDESLWHAEGGVAALLLLLWEAGAVDGSALWVTRGSLRQVLEEQTLPEKPTSYDLQPGRPLEHRRTKLSMEGS